jgi:hypothetical protein
MLASDVESNVDLGLSREEEIALRTLKEIASIHTHKKT